jgi:hypothetical protein
MVPRAGLRNVPKQLIAFAAIPPVLRPLIRAYLLGYASAVVPRLLTLLLQLVTRRKRRAATGDVPQHRLRDSAATILRTGFDWQRFPTFCAVLVGGSSLLEVPCHFPSTPIDGPYNEELAAQTVSTYVPTHLVLLTVVLSQEPLRRILERAATGLTDKTRTRYVFLSSSLSLDLPNLPTVS